MSKDLSELNTSLELLRKLHHSTSSSIMLMVIGFGVIAGSFVYSITRLRPLETEVAQKQDQIKKLTDDLKELQDKISAAHEELDETTQKLAIAKKALADAKASLNSSEDPRLQAQRTLQIVSKAAQQVDEPLKPKPNETPSSEAVQSLEGSSWDYTSGSTHYVIRFLANGRYRYRNDKGQWFDGTWGQTGGTVSIITSNGAERETGTIGGNQIRGHGQDEFGHNYSWVANRISE